MIVYQESEDDDPRVLISKTCLTPQREAEGELVVPFVRTRIGTGQKELETEWDEELRNASGAGIVVPYR